MKWLSAAVTTAALLAAAIVGLPDVGADQSALIVEHLGGATISSHGADDRTVRLVVHVDPPALAGVLDELAGMDGAVHRIVGNVIDVAVPERASDLVGLLDGVTLVDQPAFAVETSVSGEGFSLIGAPEWHEAGFRGEGTTIAVIDSGFANWDSTALAGDVPVVPVGDRIDLCDQGFAATPHGTATAEIVAEIAPDARLILACIDDALDLSIAVDALIGRGVDVVNMSLGFYNSSRGDGTGGNASPDQSAARAIAAGAIWVNSAGNEGRSHYHADFTDTDGDGRHEYAPGDELLSFVVPAKGEANVMTKWDDWPVTDQNFDICLAQNATAEPTCYGRNQRGDLPPHDTVRISNPFDRPLMMYLALKQQSGVGNPRIDVFVLGGEELEYTTADGSIAEPASAPGVIAVGAICPVSGAIREFSSQGPTISGGMGISLVGPEPISSAVYGPADGCDGGYGGTSASAPHAAAAAALLIEAFPDESPTWVRSELFRRAELGADPGALGADPQYGHGPVNLGLPPGPQSATKGDTATPPETFELTPGSADTELYGRFRISEQADRSDGVAFDGQTVSDSVFVYLEANEARPARVDYYVGNILMQVERFAGFDLGGGTDDLAFPFDTTRLENGRHRLEARVHGADGAMTTYVTFFAVDNELPAAERPLALVVTDAAGVQTPADRSRLTGEVFVELSLLQAIDNIDHVTFYLDAELVGYDSAAPYELGRVIAGSAVSLDVSQLDAGQHMIQAIAHLDDGTFQTATATFIAN